MFSQDVAKVDLALHMLQWTPSVATTCCSYSARLHTCGCGGGTSGRHRKPCGHKIETERAWDTERCETPREADMRRGRPDASPRPNVRALAFPIILWVGWTRAPLLSKHDGSLKHFCRYLAKLYSHNLISLTQN